MWLIPKTWKWGMSFGCRRASHVCSSWRCTLRAAISISTCPLNCSDCALPTLHHTPWRTEAALRLTSWATPFLSKHVLADKENHSLTQAVRWFHGLQWNSALLKCLPKSPGLGFHFMWHTQTCPWLLQTPQASVSHPPTWTSQTRNLCLKLSTMLKHQLTIRWELSFWWFHRWLGKAIL